MKRNSHPIALFASVILVGNAMLPTSLLAPTPAQATADPIIPPTWDIVSDDFESGSLAAWSTTTPDDLSLVAGAGRDGSTGLRVAVSPDAAYLSRSRVGYAVEGYLTFWFDPNDVALPEPSPNYWPPGTALRVAEIRSSYDDWWPPLIELCVRRPPGQDYQGYLAWPKASGYFYDYESGPFDLANDWQKITLGYHVDSWVAVWINDTLVRHYDSDVVHDDPSGDVIYLGKVAENSSSTPSGSIFLDDVTFQIPRVDDLWVNANGGDDDANGLTSGTAFLTLQKAASLAGPGTTVHILPGIYRETVLPLLDGSAAERVTYQAENGPGTAIIRGSEPASSLAWTQLTTDTIGLPPGVEPTRLYYADLSGWELDSAPRFVVHLDSGGNVVSRLPLAREPDWGVTTEWKTHEFWWAADGGSAVAACTPEPGDNRDCDLPQRSTTQLTDLTNDSEPAGIEAGNLTTLGNLTGARLVAMDTVQGHYTYRRTITEHDVAAGRITVDQVCEHDGGTGNPGLGWGTKYHVEGVPYLLDTPGEWWYDTATQRLYLWPPTPANPATLNIEISRRDNGFSLQNRSFTTLDGLTIEFLNGSAVYQRNWTDQKSHHNTVRNATLRYANWGVSIEASISATTLPENVIDGFTLEGSEIAYVDTLGIRLIDWWENAAAADSFTRSGVLNTVIRDNEMHHLGFRSDGNTAVGISFGFANKLRFENNHVHDIAHNGVQFSKSVIQSSKSYDFEPSEIKTGEILVKDNVFERACQLGTDCGGLKFWGAGPDNHVFRDVLITGNVFRDTYGWSYIAEKRGRYTGGASSQARGMGGYGLFVDHASGLHAYRNIAYNNAYLGYILYGVWRDGEIVYYNNVAANSLYGFSLGGSQYDTHGNVNTQIANNIIVNNEGYGVNASGATGAFDNVTIDHNLYCSNGWRSYENGGLWDAGNMVVSTDSPDTWTPYPTLAEVQDNTAWEDHGVEGDPAFWDYDVDDHELHDSSRPDFHLTSASSQAVDRGVAELPASLVALLEAFDVADSRLGASWDVGAYEFLPLLELNGTPADRAIHLSWEINDTLPPTSTWRIVHTNQLTPTPVTIGPVISTTRAYELDQLTNDVWYTVTLNAMLDATPILTDTVSVKPGDPSAVTFLPLVSKGEISGPGAIALVAAGLLTGPLVFALRRSATSGHRMRK